MLMRFHMPRRAARACSTSTSATNRAYNHCVDIVREHDRERYICNLHAPAHARPGLFALHAFNFETAKLRKSTTEESASRLRTGWWRMTLEQALKRGAPPPGHPVALALSHAHAHYRLTSRYLYQLLDAREVDMRTLQPRTHAELQTYCEHTAGSLMLLGLQCVGVVDCEAAERAAAFAGTSLGLATLLRATSLHARAGCTYLPADVTTRHGVSLSAMLGGSASPEACDAVAEVADEAVAHLLAARSMAPNVPAAARAVLLPATVADQILMRLERNAYNVFASDALEPLGLRLQLALLWRRLNGSY